MTDELLQNFKQTLLINNEVRMQAEANLKDLKDQDVRELISTLIQIISSDYYKEDLRTYQAVLIYAWNLFPSSVQDIPDDPESEELVHHPFEEYSIELVHQLLECAFSLMTNKGPNEEEVPPPVRRLASILYGRIASLLVHYDVNEKIVQKLSEVLSTAQTIDDVSPVSQALTIICEEFEPDEDETSILFNTLFSLLESIQDNNILSELLNVLGKTVISLTEALSDEDILKNTITTLLDLSTVDGIQASVFKVWNSIYKNDEENKIIMLVADQLIEISLSILADENKSEDDIIEACDLVKHITKLEFKCESDEFTPVSMNSQPLIISLIRVCCTRDDESCDDNSIWLPYMAASQTLKTIFKLLPDEDLEQIIPMMKDLAESDEYNERFGGLIILSRIIKYADNEYLGFQFIPSLFEILDDEKAPCVIFQAIKCIKHTILRYAEALLDSDSEQPSQEIIDQLPQICENCFNMMMQILAIGDEEAQQEAPQIGDLKAEADQSTVNLSVFSRNNNMDEDDDEYLYSPIALQAACLLAEVSRVQGFAHTPEVLDALLDNLIKYKVVKFFVCISKIVDYGSDEESILKFFESILEALQVSVESPVTIWVLHELGEIIQTYFTRFQEKLEPSAPTLLQILIQGMQTPTDYAADALIPIGMLAEKFPSVFVNTVISEEGQEPIPAYQLTFNTLAQALNENESSETIYDAAMCLSFIILATSKTSEEEMRSAEILGVDLSQMLHVFLELLTEAIKNQNLTISARRACINCISDLAGHQPDLILQMINEFIVNLRTFAIFEALNVSLIQDPVETQLMVAALARMTLNVMKAVDPEEALSYKDIAKNVIDFVGDLTDSVGSMERLIIPTIELLHFLTELNDESKNFVLEIIDEDENVGTLIVTARDSGIPNAQETLNSLGYTEP